MAKVMDALEKEYEDLCNQQDQLASLLERCIEEETTLQNALKMTEKTPVASKPLTSRKSQEREALKRLEEALMGGYLAPYAGYGS